MSNVVVIFLVAVVYEAVTGRNLAAHVFEVGGWFDWLRLVAVVMAGAAIDIARAFRFFEEQSR